METSDGVNLFDNVQWLSENSIYSIYSFFKSLFSLFHFTDTFKILIIIVYMVLFFNSVCGVDLLSVCW